MINNASKVNDILQKAEFFRDEVIRVMNKLRKIVDETESIVDSSYWPIPTYMDLLFGI
jgi:glutamine synthetase